VKWNCREPRKKTMRVFMRRELWRCDGRTDRRLPGCAPANDLIVTPLARRGVFPRRWSAGFTTYGWPLLYVVGSLRRADASRRPHQIVVRAAVLAVCRCGYLGCRAATPAALGLVVDAEWNLFYAVSKTLGGDGAFGRIFGEGPISADSEYRAR
jgi:hypothetical protein